MFNSSRQPILKRSLGDTELTPNSPLLTASIAFIMESSLHCFNFLARRLLAGGAFSLSSLLFFRAFQLDFADRDLFPSWGIATAIYSWRHRFLLSWHHEAGIWRTTVYYTIPCIFVVTSGRRLVKVRGRQQVVVGNW